jgi:hypothetical protein
MIQEKEKEQTTQAVKTTPFWWFITGAVHVQISAFKTFKLGYF